MVHILAGEHLQDRKHQLLFAHRASIFDLERFGKCQQIGRRLALKFLKLHFSHEGTITLFLKGKGDVCRIRYRDENSRATEWIHATKMRLAGK